ncbi:SDR family oxidoreductase [Alphaproteobacteria bacterium]|nr:SDR family oxidoreductase [Alphaproteobacteria bacterium]
MNDASPGARNALISGGTSGIGLALAQGFAAAGYNVIAAGLGPPPHSTPSICFARLDVTDGPAVAALVSELPELDVVVNAAGIIRREDEFDPDIFAQVIDINLNGTMRICTAARAALAKRSGSIINIASMLSYFGGGNVPAYSSSKGGVAQLTKSLAIAYASDAIRVNALAPGWIATPLTKGLRDDPERNNAILARTPLKRWGAPEDLVEPALFLAGAGASFITGTILNVDGGYAIV